MDTDSIAQILEKRGVNLPCQRCGSTAFTVINGYTRFILQDSLSSGIVLGGKTIPVALVGCTNCGAITPHALGALELLPKQEADTDGN